MDEVDKLTEELYGNNENSWLFPQLLNKRGMIYTEIKGEEFKSEDLFKEY